MILSTPWGTEVGSGGTKPRVEARGTERICVGHSTQAPEPIGEEPGGGPGLAAWGSPCLAAITESGDYCQVSPPVGVESPLPPFVVWPPLVG